MKPLTFENYYLMISQLPDVVNVDTDIKNLMHLVWRYALKQAVEVCNQKNVEYQDSAILDKDIITEIAAEIEQLYS